MDTAVNAVDQRITKSEQDRQKQTQEAK
jgi:hypothetical protein